MFQRMQVVSTYNIVKQLNKILTAYDSLLILIDCGIARLIACTRVSCLSS